MFELVIKYQNGTLYWTEHFNSRAEADLWIAKEQTRPYWNNSLGWVITDKTPAPPVPDAAKQAQVALIKTRLGVLAAQADMSAADIKEAVMKNLQLRHLQGEI